MRTALGAGGALIVELDVAGLDRVDVAVDGRPRVSVDVTDGTHPVPVAGVSAGQRMRVEGYAADELVGARRVTV